MEAIDSKRHYARPAGRGIRLHLGCGDYWVDGSINIDMNVYAGTDMLWDIRKGLPFQPETVELIEAYEVLEHMNKHEVNGILDNWYGLLIPNGVIKISVPDMDGLIRLYGEDKHKAIERIYGFEDHPHHKQGYTKETLTKLFEDHKFRNIEVIQGHLPERPTEDQLLLGCIK